MRRWGVGFCAATILLLVYVRLQVGLISSGYRLESLKECEAQLLDQRRVLHYNVLILRSPVILSKRLGERKIQMKPPRAVDIVPGMGEFDRTRAPLPVRFPQTVAPTLLRQASSTVTRWLEGARKAQAEPAP